MDAYTPQRVAAILRNGSDDPDEEIDVAAAVERLPETYREFLKRYGEGLPPSQAAEGLTKTPDRTYVRAIRMVTRLLNGETDVSAG